MATYEEMKNQFKDANQTLVFKCISTSTIGREKFIEALESRRKYPWMINQGRSQLCGAAAFMYCIASESPDEYGKFVLGLAMHGTGSIGSLTNSPQNAYKLDKDKAGRSDRAGRLGSLGGHPGRRHLVADDNRGDRHWGDDPCLGTEGMV
ncbi:MAG: hypothetical protein FWD67_10960 [Betaproteobacteria bacterium]|nr:hypothetical protein [Betaproteobacteria bacterium]